MEMQTKASACTWPVADGRNSGLRCGGDDRERRRARRQRRPRSGLRRPHAEQRRHRPRRKVSVRRRASSDTHVSAVASVGRRHRTRRAHGRHFARDGDLPSGSRICSAQSTVNAPGCTGADAMTAMPHPSPGSRCARCRARRRGRDRDSVGRTLASQGEPAAQVLRPDARASPAAAASRGFSSSSIRTARGAALMRHSTVGEVTFSYCLAEALTTIRSPTRRRHAMSQTVVTCDFEVL